MMDSEYGTGHDAIGLWGMKMKLNDDTKTFLIAHYVLVSGLGCFLWVPGEIWGFVGFYLAFCLLIITLGAAAIPFAPVSIFLFPVLIIWRGLIFVGVNIPTPGGVFQ